MLVLRQRFVLQRGRGVAFVAEARRGKDVVIARSPRGHRERKRGTDSIFCLAWLGSLITLALASSVERVSRSETWMQSVCGRA